jgi:MOSC domain-containing protein YiiM
VSARIVQLAIAPAGGVPKRPVASIMVTPQGITGNAVAHPGLHGGPDRALCLYSEEHILALQKEGHPIRPGAVGENVTIAGLDWPAVVPGTVLQLGDTVRIAVTAYAVPCKTIAGAFARGDSSRIAEQKHPGWSRVYARVMIPGTVHTGDAVRVIL